MSAGGWRHLSKFPAACGCVLPNCHVFLSRLLTLWVLFLHRYEPPGPAPLGQYLQKCSSWIGQRASMPILCPLGLAGCRLELVLLIPVFGRRGLKHVPWVDGYT